MSQAIYKISMLGPQGSGKGTQAKLLAEQLQIPTVSIGQLLRDEVAQHGQHAALAKEYIDAGKLVPDEVIRDLLFARIKSEAYNHGYILDGFPRLVAQAKFFEAADKFTHALAIIISDETALKRIRIREQQAEHNSAVATRSDATPEAIQNRLKIYHQETEPVIEYYKELGIAYEIDGEQSIAKVHEDIMRVFE